MSEISRFLDKYLKATDLDAATARCKATRTIVNKQVENLLEFRNVESNTPFAIGLQKFIIKSIYYWSRLEPSKKVDREKLDEVIKLMIEIVEKSYKYEIFKKMIKLKKWSLRFLLWLYTEYSQADKFDFGLENFEKLQNFAERTINRQLNQGVSDCELPLLSGSVAVRLTSLVLDKVNVYDSCVLNCLIRALCKFHDDDTEQIRGHPMAIIDDESRYYEVHPESGQLYDYLVNLSRMMMKKSARGLKVLLLAPTLINYRIKRNTGSDATLKHLLGIIGDDKRDEETALALNLVSLLMYHMDQLGLPFIRYIDDNFLRTKVFCRLKSGSELVRFRACQLIHTRLLIHLGSNKTNFSAKMYLETMQEMVKCSLDVVALDSNLTVQVMASKILHRILVSDRPVILELIAKYNRKKRLAIQLAKLAGALPVTSDAEYLLETIVLDHSRELENELVDIIKYVADVEEVEAAAVEAHFPYYGSLNCLSRVFKLVDQSSFAALESSIIHFLTLLYRFDGTVSDVAVMCAIDLQYKLNSVVRTSVSYSTLYYLEDLYKSSLQVSESKCTIKISELISLVKRGTESVKRPPCDTSNQNKKPKH